jgi:hypothetical protein
MPATVFALFDAPIPAAHVGAAILVFALCYFGRILEALTPVLP